MDCIKGDLKLNKNNKVLLLYTDKKIHFIKIELIIRCESDGGYTKFVLAIGKNIIVSKNLKYFEKRLPSSDFFRPHQSHLVNISFIDYFRKNNGGYLVMKDGKKVPLAQRRRDKFFKFLKSFQA